MFAGSPIVGLRDAGPGSVFYGVTLDLRPRAAASRNLLHDRGRSTLLCIEIMVTTVSFRRFSGFLFMRQDVGVRDRVLLKTMGAIGCFKQLAGVC